ncbi:MAG TPA: putative Ig domain-containing protein [Parafilimonas sp.]|nr:putative Ig domain-containing protein [Parafilimonas sp.]
MNITVLASVTSLSYTVQNPTYCTGNAITTNSPTSNGGGTKTYSISPALPSGLNFSTTTGAITGTPTAAAATAAYVVTVSNGCSSAQTTLNLTVLQGLSGLNYSATPVSYCVGSPITPNIVASIIGGGTITYSVSPALPTGLSINSGTGTISGTPTVVQAAANYTVTAANGCSNTTKVLNITINALPTPALTASKDPACMNENVTYTTDAGQSNYVWTFSGTSGINYTIISGGNSTSNVTVVSWHTAGIQTVTVNYNNSNGCAAPTATSKNITVLSIPTGTFSASETSGNAPDDNIICTGDPVTFTAPSGYGSYIFKVGATVVQTGTSNTYTPFSLANGASVTVDVANASNCGVTFGPIVITVHPKPTPTLSADKSSICPGGTITFTAGGGTNYNFIVDGAPVQSSSSPTFLYSNLIPGTYSVSVEVTNTDGCTATSSPVTVTVNTLPSGTITVTENSGTSSTDKKVCVGDPVTFTATAGYDVYTFIVNGIPVATGSSNVYTTSFASGPTATVKVDVTNSSTGCTATFPQQVITVASLPTGSLTASENSGIPNNNEICAGATVNFAASAGFTTYKFYVNGAGAPIITGTRFYSSSSLSNGDYVTVEVTNSNGCVATFTSSSITVVPAPSGALSASTTEICPGEEIEFTATVGFANYDFKRNGVSFANGSSNTASYTGFANGDVVTVDVTNASSCSGVFNSLTITVNLLPAGTLVPVENSGTANNDGIICTDANVVFTATPGYSNYDFKLNGTTVQYGPSNTYNNTALADGNVVTVEVTSSKGCVASFNDVTIVVHPLPSVALITGDASVCDGSTITLANTTADGVWSSSNTGIATIDASGVVTGIAAGTVTISYTVTSGFGCGTTVTKDITVNAVPVVANINGPNKVCVGDSKILTNATTGGVWASSDPGIVTVDGSGTITGVSAGTATISYSVTNTDNCTTVKTKLITVNDLPVVDVITGTMNVCEDNTTQLANTTAGGVWSSDNNFVATVSNSGLVTGKNPGNAVISYTVTDANNCNTTVTVTVTVNALPIPTLSGANPICPGATETYTTEAGQLNYIWTYTGGTKIAGGSTSDNTITITWDQPGARTIYVNYTDANGCSGANSATLTTSTGTVPVISGPRPVCEGSAGNTYSTQPGYSGYVWAITGGTITSGGGSNDATATVTWTSAGTQSISVNFTDNNGCTPAAPTVYNVNVRKLPTATIIGTTEVCQDDATPLITFTGANATAPYTFTYTINGGSPQTITTSTGNSVTLPVPTGTPGIFTYDLISVQESSTTTCSQLQTGSVTVTVNALPTATITGATEVCKDGSNPVITFTGANGTVPYTFTYNINGGAPQTVVSDGTGIATVAAPTNVSGTFIYNLVSVKDGSATTCSQVQAGSATVKVNPLPTATINGTTSVCINSASPDITFTGSGGTAPYTFTYDINGGTPLIAVSNLAGVAAVPVLTTVAGTYTYNLISVKDATATLCSQNQTGSATVTVTPASVGGSVTSDAIACSGSNTGILNLSGNIGNVIRWESSTDNFTTIATIANTTTNYTYNNLTVTTKFRAVVQSGNCSSANSVAATITVNPVSVGGTVGTSTSVCSGSNSGTLSLTGQTGSVIRWESSTDNFATITTIANTTVNYTYNNLTQTTKFRAVVQNNPCSSANSVAATITVNLLPTATISGTASVCQNATAPLITFTGANGTAPYTFIYKVNGGSNQTVVSTGNTATVSQPTGTVNTYTYTLVSVSDNKGCSQSQSGSAVITVNAPPPAFVLTPTSATICEGSVQPLSASDGVVTSGSLTFNSTNNNLAIPDPSGSTPGSRTSAITVSGIPAEAVISSVSVKFNATHGYDQDLSFNLKAPNSKVLNLVNRRGGSSNNFTNTIISSNSTNPISAGTAPFTNTYSADAANNVGYPDASNVTAFSSLFNTPNGTWTLETADHLGCHGGTLACLLGGGDYYTGTLNNWSITINYTTPTLPLNVAWSPVADLYTDAGATVAYTGTNLSTVYTKPSTPGAKTYTATVTNSDGCSTSQNVIVNVNPKPVVTATADYCLVAGKVQLTANSTPAADSYIWSTGETTQTILVDEAGDYTVTAFSAGCSGSTTINVANELVVNGDFEAGDGGFTTLYGSRTGSFYVYSNPATGLWPEGDYAVDTSAYSPSSNIGYHPNFHGKDHTTGHGKFMMINGSVALKTIWEQTVNVLPNTTYYFSAWGMNLNPASPAQLSFTINGKQRGSVADLDLAAKPTTESQVGLSNWVRFYGTWTAESNVTSAVISIVNLNLTPGGNDFGLDDISFSTLSTFINLESAPGTDAQTPCLNTPIIPIVYSAGSSGTIPDITGLPDGVTASWNGVLLTISGTPTVAGNYPYIVSTTGNCQPFTATGFINVQKQTIALSSGSATQPVCINAAITPIVFAIGGSGTGATVTGLPAGVTGSYDAGTKKFTISGTPNVAGTFNYTVNTTGTCTAASATGTITVNQQAIALASANAIQTVCADQDIDPIIYDLSGTATGASVSGLPAGVTGEVQGTSFIISGAPTAAPGTYNYTVTTTGTCTPAATATGFITVKPSVSISLVTPGTDDQTLCINASLSDIEYTLGGTALSASITSGSLPTGVNAALTGGIFKISGTPTVAGVYNYTITAEGECSDITISGKITVQKQTIALTSGSASPTLCLNSTLTSPIVFTVGTTSTGAHIAWSPSPPAGISGTYSGGVFTISSSGPVTALGTFDYTVTTEGTCGPVASFSGKITVTGTVGGTVTAAQSFLCSGSSVFINLTGHTGNILHWERSDDGGAWMNIASTSSTLNATNIIVPTQFRVLVKSGSCDPAYSSIVTVGVRYYWTGITDRDWNKALNWSNSEIPSNSCDMITIPAGPVNQPRLMGNITVPSITIMPGASVDLNGNTLTVNGSFVGTGKLKGSATSGLTIATPGDAGTVYFDPASPYNQLKTLTVNSGATLTLGGNVAAGDTLNIVAGNSATGLGTVTANGNLNANGILTLKSDNQGTARVGISAGKIDGDVTVERFIPPLRAWRLLTVPFSSSTQLVRDAWQEGVNNFGLDYSTFNKNPHPGYGTHITGNNNTSLGFDYNTTQNPSYKVWDPVANTWSATEPPTNSTVITAFNGAYCVFVRGSRAVDLSLGTGAPSSPTVLRAKGVLNQTGLTATKTISGSPGKFVLMGNPYASTINVLDIISRPATTGIVSDKFWVWDPKITGSGTDNVGAFVSYKAGVIAPNNSPTYPDVDAIKKLQSGQAFMVQLTGTSSAANMDFRESDKLDESRNVFGLRAAKPQGTTDPVIYTNLMEGTGKNIGLVDGVAASFNNRYAEKVDADDADKLWNFDENISLQRDGKSLAIEFRPLVNKKDTLFYNLSIKQQPYTLKIFAANLADPSTTEAWLVDKFLKTKISLNLADTTLYSFTPTKNAKSYTGRFMLVFKNLKKSKKNNGGNTAESIVAKTLESSVIVYPNPASTNKVSLEFTNMDKGSYEVVVYSGQGQKLATRKIVHNGGTAAHVLPLDASWAGGVYRINIIHEDSGKAVNLNLVISR